jgi:hypothetical protein
MSKAGIGRLKSYDTAGGISMPKTPRHLDPLP